MTLNLPRDISDLGYQGFALNNVGQARNSITWDTGADRFTMRRWDSSLTFHHLTLDHLTLDHLTIGRDGLKQTTYFTRTRPASHIM